MNFDFSDDQNVLRDEVRKFLVKESPVSAARRVIDTGGTHAQAAWQGLGSLGVTALMLPESCGGIGLGALELCVVAEEVGRQLGALPLASTLYLAGQSLLLGSSEAQQQRWLPRIARGEVATLAAPLDGELASSALPRFDGHALHGIAPLVADGGCAAFAVVLARGSDGQQVFVIADLAQQVKRRTRGTLDPAKPFAELTFDATPAEALDGGLDALALLARVRDRAAILLAFEQLGGADAALEMAAAYARERKAFGRTIGSYQGIKHKLADIYTANQMARAHCYYGAWALAADAANPAAEPAAELALAAASARISATQAYSLAAQENIQTHGGMGYTWELDCHLHYRRARQLAVMLGNVHAWRETVAAELKVKLDALPATPAQRSPAAADAMDFDDAPEEAAFRAECRAWLDKHAAPKARPDDCFGPNLSPEIRMQAARDWQGRKAAAGFGAITWPAELGGRGGTPIQELIWRQEEGNYTVPVGFFAVSLGMVLPSLFAHASPEVRERHIGPALQGQDLWCQLLSEPSAGSDLGMVRTRAERCSEGPNGQSGWLINGQKVWTTLAQFAQFGLVLTRTHPELPKFEGLTTFFLDMKTPGVEVRPIRQANGEAEFNEVFFKDVFVPDSQRVGAEGAGWKVTVTGLMNERLSIGGVMPAELWRTAAQMMRGATFNGQSALKDGRMRERLADLYLNAHGLWLLQCRGLTALAKGKEPGPELSVAKIVAARTLQDFGYLAIDLQGEAGVLSADERGPSWRQVEQLWFGSAGMRIAGGTDEIVKNNVGERVLGLAPEPRTDKGVAFSQLAR